ncbi:uncharacterized protein LOC120166621 [Hibiscus syriacus]|uniref:uncharacterized protein LOC120166621 n=1 Tax=Hibiscus syriacus TaxID=106335 RepID=UPI001923D488|nr:uncharacterized protein LOC120166621 [Hibiscus syriacus]
MCRSKIEGNLDIAYGLASSCSEASERRPTKARKLAEIAVHMKSLELKNEAHQQENETLKRKYEAVQLENEALQLENETLKQNSMIEKFPSTSNAIETDILKKIEADDVSRVTLKDFNLDGPLKTVGKYSVPLSLCETAKQINEVCGDISATSKFNMDSNQGIYQMFCAIIKEMKDLQFEEITEDQILKWRDVINDALRMNFNVGFAMEHLKKIAKAYDGAMRLIKLDNVNSRIFNLKAQLSAAKVEQYEISKISQVYMDAAQQFVGKRVSSGMFESAIVTARGNS